MFTYATVCSGVEGCSLALSGMGWEPVFFSEIEPFPCAVLKYHYPNVPNLGDMSKISYDNEKGIITNGTVNVRFSGRLDLLAGGTPCQDFSVAGKRGGGAEGSGTRSSLMWEWLRLARELKPRVLFWENVVGTFSSNGGRDFYELVRAIDALGYVVSWRVLDAQYTRVDKWPMAIPQRRRRVWLVGCAGGDVADIAKILFESRGLAGDTPPSRRSREKVAPASQDGDRGDADMVGAIALDGDKLKPREDQRKGGNGFGINEDNVGYTLTCPDRHGCAYRGSSTGKDVASTLSADDGTRSGQDYKNNSVVEAFRIDPLSSNSMKSSNPDSGIHQVESAQTLDTTIPTPAKNQGGDMVVGVVDMMGGKAGAHLGNGEVSPTLTHGRGSASDIHAVASTIEGVDGYNKSITGDVSATISGSASDIQHTNGVIVKNSNGGDVMPCLNANESKLGGDNQHIEGGGYVVHEL